MMLISGPAARQIDLNSGTGTLGRGVHGNAALGRAFHLAVQNIGGSVPGVTDMSNHGNPVNSPCVRWKTATPIRGVPST